MDKPHAHKIADELGEGLVAPERPYAVIGLVQFVGALVGIGKARGVAQQIDHLHRPLLRRILLADAHVGHLGQVFAHRISERKLAILDQDHRRHAGDRLGHRGDPEDRVGLQRDLAGAIIGADGLQVGELAVPREGNDGAREDAAGDLGLVPRGDARQARGREASADRVGDSQALCQSARRQPENQEDCTR